MKRSMVVFVAAAMLVAMAAAPALAQGSRVLVADVSPDGSSANAAPSSNISAAFNIRMSKSTVNSKTFYVKRQGTSAVVPAQVTYRRTTKTATLNPNLDLESGATYTAYVKGGRKGVKGAGGQRLGGTTDGTAVFADGKVTWSFTVADTTPPTVSRITPDDGAPDVATSTNVTATFSEGVDSSTITDQSFTLSESGSPVSAQVTYDENSRTAMLDPDQALEAGTTYDAKITTSVKDLAGNAMDQEKTWSFSTVADPGDDTTSVTVTPESLDFSGLCLPETRNLTVTNNGPGDVTFADVSITGPDATRFSDGAKDFLATNGPFTVLAGNHFFDAVTFISGGDSRTFSATLTYKDATGATIGNPVRLTASCLNF